MPTHRLARSSLVRELKHHALFQQGTVVRDADLVNHPVFQHLLLDDHQGIRTLVEHGAFVLALRHDAESFTEVNERAGPRRAFPERYLAARPTLRQIDALVRDTGAPVLVVPPTDSRDEFLELLRRPQASQDLLGESEWNLLAKTIGDAEESGRASPLRFGDLYDVLVRLHGQPPDGDLIQFCRAAHVLAVPARLGVPTSVDNADLSPRIVAGLLASPRQPLVDASRWSDAFPRRVLADDAIDRLSFSNIARLRVGPCAKRFFASTASVQSARANIGKDLTAFDAAMLDYLGRLDEYLQEIGADGNVTLVGWQRELVQRAVVRRDRVERLLCWGIPIALTAAVQPLLTHAPVALYFEAVKAIAPFVSGVAVFEHARKAVRARRPLVRILRGTTVVPEDG